MSDQPNKIYIDISPSCSKVAITENEELVELQIERNSRVKCVGNIYKGIVRNLLAGMDAAFVSIGLEKNGYLYVGASLVDQSELAAEKLPPSVLNVKEGDTVMVQVVKDACGTKGARVTLDVTVPGRYLVYMPFVDYIGISRKIEEENLRRELYEIVDEIRQPGSGFIIRTAAAAATAKELKQDAKFLVETFRQIQKDYEESCAPACVYNDEDIVYRTVRDLVTAETDTIVVNRKDTADMAKRLLKKISPKSKTEVKFFDSERDMFKEFGLNSQIDRLLQRKVWLKNGAYLVIDKTEALTVVDVNTGKFVGGDSLEETVFVTNMLAAREIARQVRLRNIGGIIVTDFIDMTSEEHQQKVVEELQTHLKRDRIKAAVVGMTGLGLVEITRKKTRNDTQSILMQSCPYCGGDGVVYTPEYVSMRIRIGLLDAFADGAAAAVVTVHPDVLDAIFQQRLLSRDLETVWQYKRIYGVPDAKLRVQEFKIAPQAGGVLSLPALAKLLY